MAVILSLRRATSTSPKVKTGGAFELLAVLPGAANPPVGPGKSESHVAQACPGPAAFIIFIRKSGEVLDESNCLSNASPESRLHSGPARARSEPCRAPITDPPSRIVGLPGRVTTFPPSRPRHRGGMAGPIR
eukprot:764359-Hanusia_phi.AAC.2